MVTQLRAITFIEHIFFSQNLPNIELHLNIIKPEEYLKIS